MADEQVTVETQEVPLDQATQAEYKKAVADGKDVATRETVVEEKIADEKPKIRGGFQAKIDRLVKTQAALEEAKSAAERRAAELEAKLNGNGATELDTNAEPQRNKFATEAEYIRALTRWEVKQEMKAEREAEEKQALEAQNKKSISAYNEKAIEAQLRYEDWKEVMAQDISIPTIVGDAIIHTIKNGPDVAYFLGKHPEICEEMLAVHPLEAVTMAVKISEELEKESDSEKEEENAAKEAEEREKAIKAAEIRKRPPAPIKPVSSGASRSTIPLDKADYQAYKKLRAQGRVQ